MHIYSVFDPEFKPYGRVLEGLGQSQLLETLTKVSPAPEDDTVYVPSCPELEALPIFSLMENGVYGGMPIQIGYCNGTNHAMNCMEYHRGSEVNIPTVDMVLLLALQSDMDEDFRLDSARVKAFRVPAGVAVLVYETSLHFAPVGDTFRVIVVLPRDTNTEKPDVPAVTKEDKLLWARNKWLIAHPEASAAGSGAYVGIYGENIRI